MAHKQGCKVHQNKKQQVKAGETQTRKPPRVRTVDEAPQQAVEHATATRNTPLYDSDNNYTVHSIPFDREETNAQEPHPPASQQ